MKVGVTGSCGFIGSHLTHALLAGGHQVKGLDRLAPAYGGTLAQRRLHLIEHLGGDWQFLEGDLCELPANDLRQWAEDLDLIVHLAANAGVRQGQERPLDYWRANIDATRRLLEAIPRSCRLLFASSSSVYGDAGAVGPTSEDKAGQVKSFYAASKLAGELLLQSWAEAIGHEVVAMRFFTVFGHLGRPDMAYSTWARSIMKDEPVELYGDGSQFRDFTYVDDLTFVMMQLIEDPNLKLKSQLASKPYLCLNMGLGKPRTAHDLVAAVSGALGRKPTIQYVPVHAADSAGTWSDTGALAKLVDLPVTTTALELGMRLTFPAGDDWFQV